MLHFKELLLLICQSSTDYLRNVLYLVKNAISHQKHYEIETRLPHNLINRHVLYHMAMKSREPAMIYYKFILFVAITMMYYDFIGTVLCLLQHPNQVWIMIESDSV